MAAGARDTPLPVGSPYARRVPPPGQRMALALLPASTVSLQVCATCSLPTSSAVLSSVTMQRSCEKPLDSRNEYQEVPVKDPQRRLAGLALGLGLEDGLAAEVGDGRVHGLLAHLCASDPCLQVAVIEVDAAVQAIACSSRSAATRTGRCTLQPSPRRMRHTRPEW